MRFGDEAKPLLVSVRSGARVSMPGMMDTVLNLGLNDATVDGLAAASGDPRFAWDSYRRFIQMFGSVVLGVDHHRFEEIIEHVKLDRDVARGHRPQRPRTGRRVVDRLQGHGAPRSSASPSRRTREEQLWARDRRRVRLLDEPARQSPTAACTTSPPSWGTAVNVQAMVFGNMGQDCATGVCFTRDPSHRREHLLRRVPDQRPGRGRGRRHPHAAADGPAQGQAAASAAWKSPCPRPTRSWSRSAPSSSGTTRTCRTSSSRCSRTSCTCCRPATGSAPPPPACKIAVDMAREGLIDQTEAIKRVNPVGARPAAAPDARPQGAAQAARQGPAGQPRRGLRRGGVLRRRGGGARGQGRGGHPGPHRDQPGGHPRHACRPGHPHHPRRHDQPRGGGRPRHGPALRRRRRRHHGGLRRAGADRPAARWSRAARPSPSTARPARSSSAPSRWSSRSCRATSPR